MSTITAAQPLLFRSALPSHYREVLENLFYFNSSQSIVQEGLEHAIDLFGIPRIVEHSGKLFFKLEGNDHTQTLFALENVSGKEQLVGVMIYTRSSEDTLSLIHLAVADPDTIDYHFERNALTAALFDHMRSIAKQIKNVTRLHFLYGKKNQYVRVRKQ
jgi:hypothetical protein